MFKYLVCDFLTLFDETNVPTSFDNGIDNSAIFKKEDEEFSDTWYLYHKANATLRPLCSIVVYQEVNPSLIFEIA